MKVWFNLLSQVLHLLSSLKSPGSKTSQYLVWPPFASRSATHLLHLELIRLLIVVCAMLVHSSSMAVRSCWILAGTGTRCRIRRSRASQTCSMGDMSVSMLAMQELGCFQLPGIEYRSLQHGAVHYHAATWGDGRGWMTQRWASGSRHGISVHSNAINKMHLCSLSITYACAYHNPTANMATRCQRWHQQTAHPHDAIHAVCHLPCTVKTGIHPWREHLARVSDAIECEHLPTQVGYDDELQSGRDPDEVNEHADELPWDSLCRNYLVMQTDCCSSCRLMVEKLTLIHGKQIWWTFLQSACHLHAPSKLATSVALCCVI